MLNGNLKLIISYPGKNDLEINLDNNFSFEKMKTDIINNFNISKNDSISINLFDIKYEKISDDNQIKIQLLNTNNKMKKIEELEEEINILKTQNLSIIEHNQTNIKKMGETFESLISQMNQKFITLQNEIYAIIENGIGIKNGNKDNNENLENCDNFNKIMEEINKMREININKKPPKIEQNYNLKNQIIFGNNNEEDLEKVYQEYIKEYNMEYTGLSKEKIKQILKNANYDFFDATFLIIQKSYGVE